MSKNETIWDSFEKQPKLTGAEIAEKLGVTRMNISQMLKRAMAKVYAEVSKDEPEMCVFERAIHISKLLGVNLSDINEMRKFYKLFPTYIRKRIEEDAERYRLQTE